MSLPRGEGLRVQLSKIKGLTTGDAAKVLRRPYRFQCPPMDQFSIPLSTTYSSYTNYKGTQYLGRGTDDLIVLTYRTVVVEYGQFVVEAHWDPDRPDRITGDLVTELVNRLKRLRKAKVPFRLLATHAYGERAEIDIQAVLEGIVITEQAGEQDARYLDLTFHQWRDPVVSERSRTRGTAREWPKYLELSKDKRTWSLTGIVLPGSVGLNIDANDWTFAMLAKYAYGKPSLASHIAAAQSPSIHIRAAGAPGGSGWGAHSPIMQHIRYRKGGKIKIPAPPPAIKLPTGVGGRTVAAPAEWNVGMPGEG